MALSKIGIDAISGAIQTSNIEDGAVTSAKIANNTITASDIASGAVSPTAVSDQANSSTGYFDLPAGTTAQRPGTPATGMIRYNTTLGNLEQYTVIGWVSIAAPPVITNVASATLLATSDPQTITINGSNFDAGAIVTILGANLTTTYTPATVTILSGNQLQCTFTSAGGLLTGEGSTSGGGEPYSVKVTNGTGLSTTLTSAFNINDLPTWSTTAGSLGTVYDAAAISTITLSATDPEGGGLTYTVSSGELPGGLSLSSAGAITGTPSGGSYNSSGITYNVTVGASDGSNSSATRAFSILKKWNDGSTSALAATSASYIKSTTGTTTSGLYWLKPTSWSHPARFYCEMSLHGGGWIYLLQRSCVGDNGLPGSWLNGVNGTPNHATSNFYGITDSNSVNKSAMDIWDGFVGSSSLGKVYAREIQTAGGSYDESQRYVSSADGPIYTRTAFTRLFYGNFVEAVGGTSNLSNIRVYLDNGATTVDGKFQSCWGAPSGVVTINNNVIDGNLYFCNGEDGGDANWSFGLMKGQTGYPAIANASNGGARNSTTRWGIIGIKA